MLNTTTRKVLGSLGQINQRQIISYPVTVIKMGKSIQAFLDVSKQAPVDKNDEEHKGCGEEPFEEIGVYQISELNSTFNLIDDADIVDVINDNGILTIKGNDSVTTYNTVSIDLIESEARGNPEMIKKVKNPERNTKVMEFDITSKNLDTIKKASSVLKDLSDLIISGNSDESKVEVRVTSKEKSSNSFKIMLDGNVNEEVIKITLVMDYINKLPASDYSVQVYKSSKGSLVAVFESKNIDGLDIIISSKATE